MRLVLTLFSALAYIVGPALVGLTLIAGSALAACQMTPIATLSLVTPERPVIHAQINGQAVIMMVDTGAQLSVVTPEIASRIGLPQDPHRSTRLMTIAGLHAVPNALVDKLTFPGVDLTHLSLPMMTMYGRARGQDGIVGADILLAFDLDIDMLHQKLTLYQPGLCKPVQPPWDAEQSWPINVSARRQITFAATLNGRPVTAMLDTGAVRGTLTRAAALRIGVTPAELEHDFADHGDGPLGYRFVRQHFDSLTFGDQSFPDLWLDVVDFNPGGVDMLVGDDYMKRRRLFVSYAAGRIFMRAEPNL